MEYEERPPVCHTCLRPFLAADHVYLQNYHRLYATGPGHSFPETVHQSGMGNYMADSNASHSYEPQMWYHHEPTSTITQASGHMESSLQYGQYHLGTESTQSYQPNYFYTDQNLAQNHAVETYVQNGTTWYTNNTWYQ